MIKFFHRNEVLVVFLLLILAFCQIFFSAYFDQIDNFVKSKSDTIYKIELQQQQDVYTIHFIKNYSKEYLNKVASTSKLAERFVQMTNETEYGTEYVNNLNGELYGILKGNKVEELYPELNFALSLDQQFKKINEQHPGIKNIYYSSQNGFIYKWPKTTHTGLQNYYNSLIQVTNSKDYAKFENTDKYGEKNVKVGINIFDKNNNYYGIVAYEYSNEDRYDFLSEQYNCVVRNGNDEIIYTNTSHEDDDNFKIEEILKDFERYEKGVNGDELYCDQKRYYYGYSFKDGTEFLQYLEIKDVFKQSFATAFPIVLMTISYIAFLIFQNNLQKTSAKLAEIIVDLDISHQKLKKIAEVDFLTSVYNRGGFTQVINKYVEENRRLCMAMVDIDKFKSVNDTYGHDVGDLILKSVSKTIQDSLIGDEEIGRWGGEEFIIAFTDISEEEAFEKCDKIRQKIKEIEVVTSQNKVVKVTASFGVSKHISSQDISKAIEESDNALYYSKNNGRNQVNIYSKIKDKLKE